MELEDREFSAKALKDFELIDRAKAGDQKAYADLMKRYKKSVYHTLLKMVRNVDDAEDLTIEAFAKAFKNLEKFDPKFTFSTWLFRVATNNCIDFIRKKRLDTTSISSGYIDDSGSEVAMDLRDTNMNPQEDVIRGQRMEIVQNIVTKLPPRYRTLVQLRYFNELSYEEIAKELNAPLGTVKAQLHRARELLYDLVKNRRDSI
jgi:RNA polymerase sigma factor (sigma-70 family)